VLIRANTVADAEQMIELDRVLAEAGRGMVLVPSQVATLEEERRRLEEQRRAIVNGDVTLGIVAEIDGRIVGSASLKQLRPARCRHVGILAVGVHPDFQRQGIGRALMKHLIEHARTCKLERLELYVRGDNAPAQALYVSLGFVQEGTRARFIKLEDGTYVDDFIFCRFLE
jgi:putative acetyltransferase